MPFLSCYWVLQRRACLSFIYSLSLRYLYTWIGSMLSFLSFQLSNPIFLDFSSYVRCSKPLTSFDSWLDLLQCVYTSYTGYAGEPRTRPSTLGCLTQCWAEEKISSPTLLTTPSVAWRAIGCFATGVQCWLIFSSSTKTLRSLWTVSQSQTWGDSSPGVSPFELWGPC